MGDARIFLSDEVGGPLVLRAWGDEAVVYDEMTGDTHFLAARAMAIIRLLQEGECQLAELDGRLGEVRDGPARQDELPASFRLPEPGEGVSTGELVDNLVEIGLVVTERPA